MLTIFDPLRDLSFVSVTIRLFIAVLCGGIIGIEREYKRRPAGFRTHILICMGAAITTLTSQYLFLEMKQYTDIARLGAQVISGIGFIGAGSIIVTKRQRVKGLTTAAGLWTSAIIGLACGAGYIELAVFATLMVIIAELLLIKLEKQFLKMVSNINLYIEYENSANLEMILLVLHEHGILVDDLEISRISDDADGGHHYTAVINIETSEKKLENEVTRHLSALKGIRSIEQL